MSSDVQDKVVFFGCLIVAIILHELSHGVAALFCGDDTAKRSGRLTLNPVRHIDPFGSIILPAMMLLSTGSAFGYAKPVPVNPTKMRRPREQMLWVGLAGPASNLILMTFAALFARSMVPSQLPTDALGYLEPSLLALPLQILLTFAVVNLLLAVFNMLPIPPLDGSSLIERIMPTTWLPRWYQYRQYGFLVLFGLLFWTNFFGRIFDPFELRLYKFILL